MGKHKKHHYSFGGVSIIDWSGLVLAAFIVASVTAYALFLSLGASRERLDSAPQESLALVAIAASNSVGTGINRATDIPVLLPADVQGAQTALIRDTLDGEVFFSDHFRQLSEYEEIAKIHIPTYLKGRTNKQELLEKYIDELTRHTEKAQTTLQAMNGQVLYHKNALQSTQAAIKNTQAKIESAYSDRNSTRIMDSIAELDELTLVQQDHKYGQVFGQQVAKEYQTLIQFSQKRLVVIQANIPALVQGVTVKLPEGSSISSLEELKIFSQTTP